MEVVWMEHRLILQLLLVEKSMHTKAVDLGFYRISVLKYT